MKYIDIHAHVNFKIFDGDREEVVRRALENDTWVINVGTQIDTSKQAIKLAHKYTEGVYAIVGLHPIHTEASFHDEEEIGHEDGLQSRAEEFDQDVYRELLKDPKVIGIGECGLDYYHLDNDSIEKQKEVFIEQIEIAEEVGKPLMLHIRNNPKDHSRNAYFDVCEILKKYSGVRGVSHCFGGRVEDMKNFIDLGFYISFAGNITYKLKTEIFDFEKVIKETPLDRILTDTDSPYLTPMPHRGERNEPVYVREIVKKIAEIKELPEPEVAEAIVENAKRLFGI